MKTAHHSSTIPVKQIVSLDNEEGASPQNSVRPLLSHLFGGRSQTQRNNKSKPQLRVCAEGEHLKRNRRLVDNYLRRFGALVGKDVSLNNEGMSYFSFKKFVVVVEVPMDNSSVVYIYTMVCRVGAGDDQAAVLKCAMELNYMEYLTRGATLGLDGEEVNLCYSTPISGLTFGDFKASLEAFLLSAVEINQQLDGVKTILLSQEDFRQL